MLRNKKTKKNWNENDIDILVWVLDKYASIYAKKSVHSFVNFLLILGLGWLEIYLFVNTCNIMEKMHVQVAQSQKIQPHGLQMVQGRVLTVG